MFENAVDNASAAVAVDAMTDTLRYSGRARPLCGSKICEYRPSASSGVP